MLESVKKIHFIGIGGVGMSAIAAILLGRGYSVSGSDVKESFLTKSLHQKGAKIYFCHAASNIGQAQAVVISSAIKKDNPELMAAREKNITVCHRSDILAELLNGGRAITVAGSHGKTTTSSMLSVIFDYAGLEPTVIIGGVVDYFGSNAKLGKSDYVIAEADESDGSFLKFKPQIGLITNIEDDHMDHYGNMENLMRAFSDYVGNIAPAGMPVLCVNHPQVEALLPHLKRPFISYAVDKEADYTAKDVLIGKEKTTFSIWHHGQLLGKAELSIPGRHNVQNALGAFAAAHFVGISPEKIIKALKIFHGANRRFQTKKKTDLYWIVDDYAHHPTEIKMTLKAAKQTKPKRLICVFQPHRYTRTKLLADEFGAAFKDADVLILTDVYAAGENPLPGIDGRTVVTAVQKNGQEPIYIENMKDIAPYLKERLEPGDLVITMGAGNIFQCGETLAKEI